MLIASNSPQENNDEIASSPTIIESAGQNDVLINQGFSLFSADFSRSGPDLLLTQPDGSQIIVQDYFATDTPPTLISPSGAIANGEVVAAMTGPVAPAEIAQVSETPSSGPIGIVDTASGDTTVTRTDGTTETIDKGSVVYQGDIIHTGDDGAIGLIFADDTSFSLADNGEIILDEMVFDPDQLSGNASFTLVKGIFTFVSGQIAKTDVDAMMINTPSATIGIRGTKGGIDATVGQPLNVVLAQEDDGTVGEISVSNAAGTQVLNQPFQATSVAGFNSPPSAAISVSPAQFNSGFGKALNVLPPQSAVDSRRAQRDAERQAAEEEVAEEETLEQAQEGENNEGSEEGEPDQIEGEPQPEQGQLPPPTPDQQLAIEPIVLAPLGLPLPALVQKVVKFLPPVNNNNEDTPPPETSVFGQGTPGPDLLWGTAGSDILRGYGGNDRLAGGAGNDLIDGGSGWDIVDYSHFNGGSGVAVNLSTNGATDGFGDSDILLGIEQVIGSIHNDQIVGDDNANTISGGGGSDTISGGGGADTIILTDGSDYVNGGSGNDTIISDGKGFTVNGEGGEDTISFEGSSVTGLQIYLDTSSTNESEGGSNSYTISNVENIKGTNQSDIIIGNASANVLKGNSGNDTLNGKAGNDTLTGGDGIDNLSGGSGADRFHYDALSELGDIISDFQTGVDTFVIKGSGFAMATGSLSAADFATTGTTYTGTGSLFGDSDEGFVYNTVSGELGYDSNGDTAGGYTTVATLSNKTSLTEADFEIT